MKLQGWGIAMLRTVLNDEMWAQLLQTMKAKGCKVHENSRNVLEAII